MSWLSKLTHIHLGNVGAPVGALLGSIIPGVGTSIGAGLGQGLGALGSGKNLKTAALQGAVAGGGTKLGLLAKDKLLALLKGGAASPVLGGGPTIQTGASGGVSADPMGGSTSGIMPGEWGNGGGGDSSWLGKLGSLATGVLGAKNKDGSTNWGAILGSLGKIGLGGVGAYEAAKKSGESDAYRKKAIAAAEAAWAQGAPLRTAGLAGMTAPEVPIDVASIYNRPRPTFRRITA